MKCSINDVLAKVNILHDIFSLKMLFVLDINECEVSPNICEQKCVNVQGSYYVSVIKVNDLKLLCFCI